MEENTQVVVKEINDVFNTLSELTGDELRNRFNVIRSNVISEKVSLDSVLVEVFAIVKETMRRLSTDGYISVDATPADIKLIETSDFVCLVDGKEAVYRRKWNVLGEKFTWDMIPYDEQLQGGVEIHKGKILEMATGEGKTLVAIAPVVLNAVSGKGVHLMTVNDYLSRRDFEMTRPIYSFLGLSVGCIERKSHRSPSRKEAYDCDITFGTTSGFVFDYLFDNTVFDLSECVQKKFGFAIVDEADSVMIDKGKTPHILSEGYSHTGEGEENIFVKLKPLVTSLVEQKEEANLYKMDSLRKKASFTEKGKAWIAEKCAFPELFDDSFYDNRIDKIKQNESYKDAQREGLIAEERNNRLEQLKIQNVLLQLLTAVTVYKKDIDYVVSEGNVIIVDQNTGRLMPSHVWEHGLHEAVAAKENLSPNRGIGNISGTITIKNYLSRYGKLSGMTGTAATIANEWRNVYRLDVAVIQPHKPVIREEYPIRAFVTKKSALEAVYEETLRFHKEHRPVLVGVNSIKESDYFADFLRGKGLEVQLLNAKSLSKEAEMISKAGQLDCITVATNVAGRGTDIKPSEDSLEVGGLAVIGMGLSDSQRIDRQLIGRSGRQGNPGSSQFFVSCEDEIIGYLSLQEKKKLEGIVKSCDSENGEIVADGVSEIFQLAQRNKEHEDEQSRAEANKRDDEINPLRERLYDMRMQLLKDAPKATIGAFKLFGFWENESFELKYDNNRKEIVSKVMPLIERALEGMWNVNVKYFVPFIAYGKAFTIACDFRKAVSTHGDSLMQEFEHQVLVRSIDKLLLSYINEINSYCVSENEYDTIYKKNFSSVKKELEEMLLSATLPVNEKKGVIGMKAKSSYTNVLLKDDGSMVGFEDLCPCGSGKPYWQCHGRLRIDS